MQPLAEPSKFVSLIWGVLCFVRRSFMASFSDVQLALAHPFYDGGIAVGKEAARASFQLGNLLQVRIQCEIEDRNIHSHSSRSSDTLKSEKLPWWLGFLVLEFRQ